MYLRGEWPASAAWEAIYRVARAAGYARKPESEQSVKFRLIKSSVDLKTLAP
jgi:hypothetical protein